jgi:hypothetical protein
VCVCVRIFARNVSIGWEPTNRDAEFFGAVERSLPIGRIRTDGAFILVGGTESSDWSGTDQSRHGVLSGCQMERILIGREPTNQNALIGRFQTKQSS